MRIPSGWALLAATILSRSAVADDSHVTFSFNSMSQFAADFKGNKTSIFGYNSSEPSKALVIEWTPRKDTSVHRFELFVLDPTSGEANSLKSKPVQPTPAVATVTATPTPTFSFPTPCLQNGNCAPPPRPGKRGSGLSVESGVDFQVSDNELRVEDMATLLRFEGKPLYFRAFWVGSGDSSYSRAFTVLETVQARNPPAWPAWAQEYFVNPIPLHPDGFEPSSSSPTPSSTPSADISQPSSTGGLPTGAIAGIAVGCAIVVLAIIGFLVWFFLRRRQQARDDDTLDVYRNGRTRTDELMAEKEANAGVDASPHSPYSDEGQRDSNSLHHVGTGAGAAAAALVGNHKKGLSQSQSVHGRSYTPYSDRQESMARSPSTHAASIAAPSTALGAPDSPNPSRAVPRGALATPYAHLVEEGMTEEEIRRLEDEERALDAAIEQSTRRP